MNCRLKTLLDISPNISLAGANSCQRSRNRNMENSHDLQDALALAAWLPEKNRCWYLAKPIDIKMKYGLTMDAAEAPAILKVYEACRSFETAKPNSN